MRELISKTKAVAAFLWDVIIPRFITEDVALRYDGNGLEDGWGCYEIVCAMQDVGPNEEFDAIATTDAFQAFGIGFCYRIGNMRPWPGKGEARG